MAYKEELNNSETIYELPFSLLNHLETDTHLESSTTYAHPEIENLKHQPNVKALFSLNIDSIRLPARINYPLIPYTDSLKNYILTGDEKSACRLHSHHHSHLKIIKETMSQINIPLSIKEKSCVFDINILRKMATEKYSKRTSISNLAALAFAARATSHDLNITAMTDLGFSHHTQTESEYMSFLLAIQRLRALLVKLKKTDIVSMDTDILTDPEPKLTLYNNYSYSYTAISDEYTFILIVAGGHFRIYHSNQDCWFAGAITYLDYMFTTADIMNNIEIISTSAEYSWAVDFLTILQKLSSIPIEHNIIVEFMKNLEGFLLNISDYDTKYAMNWKPLLEISYELWKLDKIISNVDYEFKTILLMIDNKVNVRVKKSILSDIILSVRNLERQRIQELSSLHKFIYYAEVDSEAGVSKFLKRVHTPRKIDQAAVKNITRLAKQLFFLSYLMKHKILPNLEGPQDKTQILRLHGNKGRSDVIKTLPLSWWDDIKIYNCMDNTLTGDALEFAKDKGALKREIHLGPGDSRKELLQVIELQDYKLKDFFSRGPFIPKSQAIYRTTSSRNEMHFNNPVRLIPKEREQKIEARLFANGELSDKHALSLVTTQMKKVLSYFDEQMMTPSDKSRKNLLHKAAQSLIHETNYSLLLDIEGHNQSMQAENTRELSEFCGNLFGFDGWGTLPDYFSTIDVYHYDEYEDNVILSNGQLGGIEGWLNPLWTLHTTLMMKLIRHMTDIEIEQIMVYSDDVDSIIRIEQPTENTIQSIFNKVISHCGKFGMIVKMNQTNLSKHRVTMLRQHYSHGIRADSTLKKLISTSGANNSMIMSEEIEIAGICSSVSSALELSNHSETCCYLKNYKIGLLLVRLPHIILSKPMTTGPISEIGLPKNLVNLIYHVKDDITYLIGDTFEKSLDSTLNDVSRYLNRHKKSINKNLLSPILSEIYGTSISKERFIDSPERLFYLQIYDDFLKDLLFFWTYLPASLGGLGGILHVDLMLSGQSSGFSKAIHYLHQWIINYSSNSKYFLDYLTITLSVDLTKEINSDEARILSSTWPCDRTITTATTSISQSIESMVVKKTKNINVLTLVKLKSDKIPLSNDIINIFRPNFHTRIAQFYYENTSIHFLDLLINKIETSSGLLTAIKSLSKLRNSLAGRMLENIKITSKINRTTYGNINAETDTVEYLLERRCNMFPTIIFNKTEELLYDNKLEEVTTHPYLLSIRRGSPMHYDKGLRVYDDPHMGNEIRYKGELIDDDRMLGNKEEFLVAKLMAVTKWFMTKSKSNITDLREDMEYDCIIACNLSISTLTGQNYHNLMKYTPNETGGEILHRIPNVRFSTSTYLRAEMNTSLEYTAEINQKCVHDLGLIDSNINFDYVRLRYLLAAVVKDKYSEKVILLARFRLTNFVGIHDVQYISPQLSHYNSTHDYQVYGNLRNHEFSKLRFRFMANSYLDIEDTKLLALIPNNLQESTQHLVSNDIIQDLIYKYARSLDAEYMTVLPTFIDIRLWEPLILKIKKIDYKTNELNDELWIDFLQGNLIEIMTRKKMITVVSRDDKLKLTLQGQCVDALDNYRPKDIEFREIISRYTQLLQYRRGSNSIHKRMAKYQQYLLSYEDHRSRMARIVICEYILYFHFQTSSLNSVLIFDANKSFILFKQSGISTISMSLVNPDIHIQIMMLGIDFIQRTAVIQEDLILEILNDIAEDHNLADMIIPEKLPNLTPCTNLMGDEIIPEICKNTNYEIEAIPYSAMSTLSEIQPLCKFAHKCSTIGADPSVYSSITGSDSLTAQYGLFYKIKNKFDLDSSTNICDVTGGRGDFKYVARDLGLTVKTYSKLDRFTGVLYHPDIDFSKEYDIRHNESLKFLLSYDFVHVDISFTGSNELNILDLVLLLESNNIAYSIRLNSVILNGYTKSVIEGLPIYTHYISYPGDRINKPYQIYLIGIPGFDETPHEGPTLKKTVAFRAIALSYGKLLSKQNHKLRLWTDEINSSSIYFHNEFGPNKMIKSIVDNTTRAQSVYYMRRYVAEIEDGELLYWCEDHLLPTINDTFKHLMINKSVSIIGVLKDYSRTDIGTVSSKSLNYHIKHLADLQNDSVKVTSHILSDLDPRILEYFRIHHPLQGYRSKCNVVLGMIQFNYQELISGRKATVTELSKYDKNIIMKNTLHQTEIQSAIKMLIISASINDYVYGSEYFHYIISLDNNLSPSALRALKCYRLLSYYFHTISDMISVGEINIRNINSIRHEMEAREINKQKYKPSKIRHITEYIEPDNITQLIEHSFDDLFKTLESWAVNKEMEIIPNPEEVKIDFTAEGIKLDFNLDIDGQIDNMITNLGLSEKNKHGFIDLGDDIDTELWDE